MVIMVVFTTHKPFLVAGASAPSHLVGTELWTSVTTVVCMDIGLKDCKNPKFIALRSTILKDSDILKTIFSVKFWSQNEQIKHPEFRSLFNSLSSTIIDARAKSTVEKYAGYFKRFVKWTDKYSEIKCVLPCQELYVGLYLQNLMQSANHYSVIESAFYGIKWAHNLAGVANPCDSEMLLGRYHGKHDREIGKETSERDSKSTMLLTPNVSPDKFEKAGNSEVWKFINERTKMPNTCKRKQLCTNISGQEISWDEIVQNIIVPDIGRTEDRHQNGCFGGSLDEIKTGLVNPQQYTSVFHTKNTERKKLCKLCQDRELDTIFLPCGHLVCCHFCCRNQNFKLCPQCFKEIEHVNEAHF
ncbi:MYLIP [Mytilus coruscus]|uniref:MYLIP n=1 Tax=Mytilus coruscus TaxID=42192 RepID=A0A6J8D7U2_MYTCO|nr:MYLIP [Mytilus coruscus]